MRTLLSAVLVVHTNELVGKHFTLSVKAIFLTGFCAAFDRLNDRLLCYDGFVLMFIYVLLQRRYVTKSLIIKVQKRIQDYASVKFMGENDVSSKINRYNRRGQGVHLRPLIDQPNFW